MARKETKSIDSLPVINLLKPTIGSLPRINLLDELSMVNQTLGFGYDSEMCEHSLRGCEGADCLGLRNLYCYNNGEGCSIKAKKDRLAIS